MRKWMIAALAVVLLVSCRQVSVPQQYTESNMLPKIYPEYFDVTVPVNIAPLSFELLLKVDEAVTRFSAEGDDIVCGGVKACPDIEEWKSLTAKAKGKDIKVEVFVRKDGSWLRFMPFSIHVLPPHLSLVCGL